MTPFRKPSIFSKKAKSIVQTNFKVLHISDTHIDLNYKETSDAVCGEPLCCRNVDKSVPIENQSGFWGDYRDCDIPLRTFDSMLKHIALKHQDIDYVIWTGDIPPHDVWNQTKNEQVNLLRKVSQLIQKHLGSKPIFPALGNHESLPINKLSVLENLLDDRELIKFILILAFHHLSSKQFYILFLGCMTL